MRPLIILVFTPPFPIERKVPLNEVVAELLEKGLKHAK
jgi:hypothetical protein